MRWDVGGRCGEIKRRMLSVCARECVEEDKVIKVNKGE